MKGVRRKRREARGETTPPPLTVGTGPRARPKIQEGRGKTQEGRGVAFSRLASDLLLVEEGADEAEFVVGIGVVEEVFDRC